MGARLVQDINPAGSSSPNGLISLGGLLYFTAELGEGARSSTTEVADTSEESDAEEGEEESEESTSTGSSESSNATSSTSTGTVGLIRSDGTGNGTTILKSFDSVTNLVTSGEQLYFIAGIDDQYQLWSSDGTTRGTQRVKDLYPNADTRYPQDLFEIDGVLFYSAIDATGEDGKYPYVNGYEVWRREGEGIGSRVFRNLIPDKIIDEIDISDEEITSTPVDANGNPIELTKTTTVTTVNGPNGITTVTTTVEEESYIDGRVVTSTTTKTENEETSASTIEGTTVTEEKEFASITENVGKATVTTEIYENDSFPRDFTGINGNYFFAAYSSSFYTLETRQSSTVIGGLELWFSDGTEAGTRPINVNQNAYTIYEPDDGDYIPAAIIDQPEFGFYTDSSSSFPRELTPSRDRLYFVANDGISGFELWSISDEGQDLKRISDLNPGNTSSSPEDLTIAGKNLYFSADNGSGRKLFYFNESLDEPKEIRRSGNNPENLTTIGNKLFYSAESEFGRELWSVKKTTAELVQDINPGPESSSPSGMTMTKRHKGGGADGSKKNILYFTANDGSHGIELMSIPLNGKKKNKTVEINSDIIDGPSSSFPRELFNHNQELYFTANNKSKGRELWKVGPSIQGPIGEAGEETTQTTVFENETFVYQFRNSTSEDSSWKINGGADASLLEINTKKGKLSFRKAPDFENPGDKNLDNIYQVFVRSTEKNTGHKADQEVLITVADINEGSNDETTSATDEILYYTADCGPITANGPLNPCDSWGGSGSTSISGISENRGPVKPPKDLRLTTDGRANYNQYNEWIDDFNSSNDCTYIEFAKTQATSQLDFQNDSTLAEDWNRYADECGLSEIII